MANTKVTEQDLKDDFCLFVVYVWNLLGLPPPTKIQLRICRFLADGGNPRKIIEAFRGVGKSYITCAFVVWLLWKDPNLKFLVVSASKNRADNFSMFCQQLIDLVPQLQHLRPQDRNTSYTKVKWYVEGAVASGSPSVLSVGIYAAITGMRADYIIADDVEVPNNVFTVEQREKLKERVTEFEAIKKADEGDGKQSQIIYLGTPQCEESLYNHLRESGYVVRIWPALYPTVEKIGDYKGSLCPEMVDEIYSDESVIGQPTDPKRFTWIDLEERKLHYGKAGFALQFQLDTSLSDAEKFPLRLSDLIVFDAPSEKAPTHFGWTKDKDHVISDLPRVGFSSDRWRRPMYVEKEYLPYENSVMFIDPSGRGTDETSYAVVKFLMGYLFVTRAGGVPGGYDENSLKQLAVIAKQETVRAVVTESNFGDGMFNQLFKPILHSLYPCHLDEVRHNTQKESRIIDTLEPVMARHRLIVSTDVIETDYRTSAEVASQDGSGGTRLPYSLFYQLTHITKEKGALIHDDRLDALAGAVAYFTEKMARDETKELSMLRDRRMDEWLHKKTKGKLQVVNGTNIYQSTSASNMLTFM